MLAIPAAAAPATFKMLAITIGNFDGVHRGHAALLQAARRMAGDRGRCVAVTFEPAPAEVLGRRGGPSRRLTLPPMRESLLRTAGADEVVVLETTPALLSLDPVEFIRGLRDRLPFEAVCEGSDFRFGRGRAGGVETLRAIGLADAFEVVEVPQVEVPLGQGVMVPARSSLVRWMLAHGRVGDVAAILGRIYTLEGVVVRGDQRGRTLDCPTANLDHGSLMLPADGVYAGVAELPDGRAVPAAISVGRKPSFHAEGLEPPPICEAHLLGETLPLDAYGWPLRLRVGRWLRGQLPFPEIGALLEQMRRDLAAVRAWWALDRPAA